MADAQITGQRRALAINDGLGFPQYVVLGYVDGTGAFKTTSSSNPVPVNPNGGVSINTGQVVCASAVAATQIVAANANRLAITLFSNENGNTWISNSSASTTASSTGFQLKGQTPVTLHTQSAIYGLASSGTTAKTSYIEEVQ